MSAKRVPQLSDAAEVVQGISRAEGVRYPVLVPNMKVMSAFFGNDLGHISSQSNMFTVYLESQVCMKYGAQEAFLVNDEFTSGC